MYGFDYITLGTVGFAQVGRPDYESKVEIEKKVINGFFQTDKSLVIPKEFKMFARFRWTLCPHDFGSYYDFQIYYNRDEIDSWEYEEDSKKYYRFYDWVNDCETAMGTNEERLIDLMNSLYQKEITMEIVHRKLEERALKVI